MTSYLIQMIGSPSVGKSTTAAKLFTKLKDLGLNTELVTEYCKNWIWDKREITPYSEMYFFGKQSHAESHLFNKVEYIVTDSPTLLAAFYQWYYNGNNCLSAPWREFYKRAAEDNVKVISFFLPRKKKYETKGRLQTEKESDEITVLLKEWLDSEGYSYEVLECPDKERINVVLERIKEMVGDLEGMALE